MQYKKLNVTEVNKGVPQSQRKSLSGKPANMMATARQAAVVGVLGVGIHPVFVTPHSFRTAHCMESIHWLLSSSMPHFFEMMEFENCLILLCEAKVKVLR